MKASDADEARALRHGREHVDIYSNSWGPDDKGFKVAGPGYFTKLELRNGVEKVTFFPLDLAVSFAYRVSLSYKINELSLDEKGACPL